MKKNKPSEESTSFTRYLDERFAHMYHSLQEQFDMRVEGLISEMTLALDQVSLLKTQVRQLEDKLKVQAQPRIDLNRNAPERSAATPYTLAIEMAKKGFDQQEIVNACKITSSEVKLIMALHHRAEGEKVRTTAVN